MPQNNSDNRYNSDIGDRRETTATKEPTTLDYSLKH